MSFVNDPWEASAGHIHFSDPWGTELLGMDLLVLQGLIFVYLKDVKVKAKGRKETKILTLCDIPWWLLFVSPFHNIGCPLLSGWCMFLLG